MISARSSLSAVATGAALVWFLGACASPGMPGPPSTSQPGTTAPPTTTTGPSTTPVAPPASDQVDTGELSGFGVTSIRIGAASLLVAVADTVALRSHGLMEVEELGDLDGMLFTWGGETTTSAFTMRNTLIPLDIAFFDREGGLVDVLSMVPCETNDCPTYSAAGPYAYAVEVPAGRFANLGPGDRLTLEG